MNADQLQTPGTRLTFDLLCMWIQQSGVQRIQIASADHQMLDQLIPRLPEGTGIAQAPDMVLYPFSLEEHSPGDFTARFVAGCFVNRFSYRRILHPALHYCDLPWLCSKLDRSGYRLLDWRGIYPPGFLFWWALSLAFGPRSPSFHFFFEEKSFQNLMRRTIFTHIIAFYAQKVG